MIVVCLLSQLAGRSRIGISLFFVLAASFAWTRPDPLQSVPEVEGIIGLALTVSPLLAMFCIASLAAAIALFTCFLVCALMPLLGAFPVPLVGMGMSPILGYWLGIGTLIAVKATS